MNRWRLLAKYGAIGTGISLCMIVLSYYTTIWVNDQGTFTVTRLTSRILRIKEVVDAVPPAQRAEMLAKSTDQLAGFNTVYLLDHDAKILFPPDAKDLRRSEIEGNAPAEGLSEPFSALPARKAPRIWIDLEGTPKQYLLVERSPIDTAVFSQRFSVTFAVLSLALFIGVMASILIIFYFFRDREVVALDVMARIKKGDLKARIPDTLMDEFAYTSRMFNQMADEIEALVNSLRTIESSRSSLLRELAHDLRTPIAGLKSVVETLKYNRSRINQEKTDQLMDLAEREVNYFGALVEDLLILGSLDEPTYNLESEPVSLTDLIEEELSTFSHRFPNIEFSLEPSEARAEVRGSFKLLRRAIRNALENASFYAATRVTVQLVERPTANGGEVRLWIEDDGPGFNEPSLVQFGKKRASRVVSEKALKRISVGLGSVIMKSIVERHRGTLTPSNRKDNNQKIGGARLEFTFPLRVEHS